MYGDIKNKVMIVEYPTLVAFESISTDEIIAYIDSFQTIRNKYLDNKQYYIGNNKQILDKYNPDRDNPDSRVPVPYARTMTQTIKGYMYKPGLITYDSEDEAYLELVNDILETNDEPVKTAELGEHQAKYGIGIELFYTSQNEQGEAIPAFTPVLPENIILFFSQQIQKELVGAIRYFEIERTDKAIKYTVEVYYTDRIEVFTLIDSLGKREIIAGEAFEHFYDTIPIAIYKNNTEYNADYESVKSLIDSYDVLASDSVNEINRFASAYLILNSYLFTNPTDVAKKNQELEALKTKRVLEFLDGEGGAKFLTKDIPSDFFRYQEEMLKGNIEYHSQIPDFRSAKFDAKSGEAMKWALLNFENLAGDKQSLFELGLNRRFKLIGNFLQKRGITASKIIANFKRNLPNNVKNDVEIFAILAESGKLANIDLLKTLPASILADPEEAVERAAEQKEEDMKMFNMENMIDGGQDEAEGSFAGTKEV